MDGMPADGGFAALFASPTLVWLLRLFLARPDTDFCQRELADLQAVFAKTVGIADVLRAPLLPLRSRIDLAFVFGSAAAGRESATSDVDLLIVSGHDPRVLAIVLAEAGQQLGREVNVTTYSTDEFRARLAAGRAFLTGVLDGAKIWLVGNDADLRAVLDGAEAASA